MNFVSRLQQSKFDPFVIQQDLALGRHVECERTAWQHHHDGAGDMVDDHEGSLDEHWRC